MPSRQPTRRSPLCQLGIATVLLTGGVRVQAEEGPKARVETLDDEVVGRLVSLNERGGVTLEGDTFARLPAAEVLMIRFESPAPRRNAEPLPSEVTLTDGSRFAYAAAEFDRGLVWFRRPGGGELAAPIEAISSWRLDRTARWERPDKGSVSVVDVLLVKNRQGDGVTPVEGVVLEVTAEGVRFSLDADDLADPVTAPWDRLAAIRFYRDHSLSDAPRYRIHLRDGGGVSAETLTLASGRLEWDSVDQSRGAAPLRDVKAIDLSRGRVQQVSALKLLDAAWRPYFDGPTDRRGHVINASLDGQPMRLRFPDPRLPSGWPGVTVVREFPEGVALRSRGELRFALPAAARRLKGWVGLDPATVLAGSAEVSVFAGDRLLWSGVVDGSTRPVALNEALDASPNSEPTLTLRVDYGDNLDAGDNVHFADLRVIQ